MMEQPSSTYKEPLMQAQGPQPPAVPGAYFQTVPAQSQVQGPPQQVMFVSATGRRYGWSFVKCDNYKHRQSKLLGIGMIVVGIGLIIVTATLMGMGTAVNFFGIMVGVGFALTGVFGLIAATSRTQSWVSVFMIFCFMLALGGMIVVLIVAVTLQFPENRIIGAEVVIAILGVAGTVMAIWGSVLGIKVLICETTPSANTTSVQPGQVQMVPLNQNVIYTPPAPGSQGHAPYPGYMGSGPQHGYPGAQQGYAHYPGNVGPTAPQYPPNEYPSQPASSPPPDYTSATQRGNQYMNDALNDTQNPKYS